MISPVVVAGRTEALLLCLTGAQLGSIKQGAVNLKLAGYCIKFPPQIPQNLATVASPG